MKRLVMSLALVAALFVGMGTAGSEEVVFQGGDQVNLVVSDDARTDSIRLVKAAKSTSEAGFSDVAAIIEKYHCTVCHVGAEPREGLRLDTYDNVMKGGEDGPVVVPGAPAKSELVQRVKGAKEPRMPMTGPPWLTKEEVKTIESWIAAGAKGPKS